MHRGLSCALLVTAGLCSALVGCIGARLPSPPQPTAFTIRDDLDVDRLATAQTRAEARPHDARAQFAAGMAHVRATLTGHLSSQSAAEHYLERAYRLDPQAYPSARVLGRFTNMRSSVLDTSKVSLQVELYRSLQTSRNDEPIAMSAPAFHLHGFVSADLALRDLAEGRRLSAWRRVRQLERELKARTKGHPDEIDSFAMAGTFASTFAAALPVGRDRRAREAAEYFEVQQARWHELSASARNTGWAPNTRTVFALALAELWLAVDERQRAEAAYRRVLELDEPDTGIREQLRSVASHRLENAGAYAGDRRLLPAWPSGPTGCVACHARDTWLPTTDLFVLPHLATSMGQP